MDKHADDADIRCVEAERDEDAAVAVFKQRDGRQNPADNGLEVLVRLEDARVEDLDGGRVRFLREPEEPGEGIDPDYVRFFPGLDLTEVNVLPHYQKVKNDTVDGLRLFEDITLPDSQGRCFFAIPDGSYFYQDEGCLLLYGESYLVRDGVLSPLTQDGEFLDMEHFE